MTPSGEVRMPGDLNAWKGFLEAAAGIKTPISVIVVAVGAVLVILKTAGKKPNPQLARLLNWGLVVVVILGVSPYLASWSLDYQAAKQRGVYRVSATVVAQDGTPREHVRVSSNLDAVPKALEGGRWELDVPAGVLPKGRVLTLYAKDADSGDVGNTSVELGNDENVAVSITLQPANAMIRGSVTDGDGASVPGVRVQVVGYSAESVLSDLSGGFVLPSHVAEGTRVKLHLEKLGYAPSEEYVTAGAPVGLELKHTAGH